MMYYFLVASLPLLELNAPAPFPTAEFDGILQENLDERAQRILFACRGNGQYPDNHPVYRQMALFEEYLRNRIARKRADRAGIHFESADPEEYFSEVDFGLAQASGCADPLERERLVDKLRWERLEELSIGHDFDLDALIIYRCKLFIVNKYAGFRTETGTVHFTAALERIINSAAKPAKEL